MEAPDKLDQLRTLVRLMQEEEARLATHELSVKQSSARLRAIVEDDIPELMTELGLSALKLEDGSELKVSSEVYAAITEANKDQAYAWLEEHGHGGIVKFSLSLQFEKGQEKVCLATYDALLKRKALQKLGISPIMTRSVHAATLKSFLRERLEQPPEVAAAEALPLELFGARPVKVAKIKVARKSKATQNA